MSRIPSCLTDAELSAQPLEAAHTLPASLYNDEAVHRWELSELLAPCWQFVAHHSEVACEGDFVVRDIAGAPVLCIRGADGSLRAFYNVCRHRAGPVAAGRGSCRLLRCGYHGWVYNLDGSLQHAPELGDIANFDKRDHHLVSLQVIEAGSLCFVKPQAMEPDAIDPVPIMAAIDKRAGGVLRDLVYRESVSYTLDCNWKVYVDNYLEGYHIPQVHPALARALDFRHYSTETYDGYSLQHAAIEAGTEAYGAGEALYYFVFPNLMLNILPGRLQTNVVIPLSHNRCRIDFVYFYPPTETANSRLSQDLEFSDLVQREDIEICERVQQGLESGAYDAGRFSVARESGVHHWQELYKALCRRRIARALK